MELSDTIAAISTPYGRGGISVIRISGSEALQIADKVFKTECNKSLSEFLGGRTAYGRIYYDGQIIDDGIAAVFRAPHSFTGEDTVEINCHGGIVLTQTVLEAILTAGARMAEPGEFTKRAFLSGKIKLSQAEAVINLIDAESTEKIKLASAQSRGVLAGKIDELYNELADITSSVYAYIDYPDEDLTEMTLEELRSKVEKIYKQISDLCDTYRMGHAISEGIPTVIIGKPNTGKSSVLNRILGEERAIVTSVPGTTRDTVEETVTLGKVLLRLCDTAGIHITEDEVEKIGVERSLQKLSEAELIIAVFDGSNPLTEEDVQIIEQISMTEKTVIPLINKKDINVDCDISRITSLGEPIYISAKYEYGFEDISKRINDLYVSSQISYDTTPILTGSRQYAAAKQAKEHIKNALTALTDGFTQDVAGMDIEYAMASLGEIDGRTVTEEITSKIFSRFCVGK